MQTISQLSPLREQIAALRGGGKSIGLVPTMGALHAGHLALIRAAQRECDHVAASIFVNPTQFGEGEDLASYPRQLAEDQAMLEAEGVDLLWAPGVDTMYPQGFASNISVKGVSEHFCGASRPGHFDGVATVVCKLFHQMLPDKAFFGEKDWQQLAVIRAMARDLDLTRPFAHNIVAVPTVREADGLALSSRNTYLSSQDRARAAALPRAMRQAIVALEDGVPVEAALEKLEADILAAGFSSLDYAALADAQTLQPLTRLGEAPARLLVAGRIGTTRLIDNMAVTIRL